MYTIQGFGFVPATVVATAATNVAVDAYNAIKVSKMQEQFQAQLKTDEEKKQYLNFILARVTSIADRLGQTGNYIPGSKEFDEAFKKLLAGDMWYRGNCDADIYVPITANDVVGRPRQVWASIDHTGYVTPGANVPPDVGPIWATGCKNALDTARMAYIDIVKGIKKQEHYKAFKEDIGTMDVFLRAGLGIFMVIVLVAVTKFQRAVLKEQRRPRKKKKVVKKKP